MIFLRVSSILPINISLEYITYKYRSPPPQKKKEKGKREKGKQDGKVMSQKGQVNGLNW